jgi:hypothetical protein
MFMDVVASAQTELTEQISLSRFAGEDTALLGGYGPNVNGTNIPN